MVRGNLPVFMAMHMANLPTPVHENGVSQDLYYLGWLMLTSKLFMTGSIIVFLCFYVC